MSRKKLPQERWKAIPDFPGYEVSDQGRVQSFVKNRGGRLPGRVILSVPRRILVPHIAKDGYARVKLYDRTIAVHKLVLNVFAGIRPVGKEARHKDGKKENNKLKNLKWDTPKNNNADKVKHGTHNRGECHLLARLSEKDILRMYKLFEKGNNTDSKIGKLFGIDDYRYVWSVRTGKSWKYLFKKYGKDWRKRNV